MNMACRAGEEITFGMQRRFADQQWCNVWWQQFTTDAWRLHLHPAAPLQGTDAMQLQRRSAEELPRPIDIASEGMRWGVWAAVLLPLLHRNELAR